MPRPHLAIFGLAALVAGCAQSETDVGEWCKADNGVIESSCFCGSERPSYTEQEAHRLGHRVEKEVIHGPDKKIERVRVHDYFMPQDGSTMSSFANIHTYFPTLEGCRAAVRSKQMP